MDRNNTKTAIANEPREEIDADFAVGMVRDGFHVFIDNTDKPLTYDMVFGSKEPFDFDNETHVFTAPMMEVAQENALESLCGSFDSLNDDVKDDGDMSLEDYADEVYEDDESQYRWRGSLSEWENIRNSILSDKTEYLQRFLNDASLRYPSIAAELREDFSDYTAAYLNRNKVEHIPQQDISHKNADLSATRGERQEDLMANTKMECTGMVMLAEDSKAKAVATVTVNDEFVIKGIKVYDGANGLFASMPSRKIGGEYQDIVFPITKEAREQINNAVLETYGKLAESGLDKLPLEEKAPPEKSASKITVSLHQIDDEKTKAVGQIVIDDSIVVSGVKVRHGTNAQGEEKDFVSMPSYQTQTGEYNEYAHAITKDCRDKINKAVLGAYETLSKTEYKGVKFSELGNKSEISSKYGMNNQFAQKLMGELDKANIPYSARVAETTSLSVKNADKATVDKIQKDLTAALNKQPEQHQSKPKTR